MAKSKSQAGNLIMRSSDADPTMPAMLRPKISIVTVCRNNLQGLRATLGSVFMQEPIYELIVVDGASSDGTKEFLTEVRNSRNGVYLLTDPNLGVYAAQNIGLQRATGEFVNFLNAGDTYASPDTLSEICGKIKDSTSVIYGDSIVVDPLHPGAAKVVKGSHDFSSGRNGLCHQAVFFRTEIHRGILYDTRFSLWPIMISTCVFSATETFLRRKYHIAYACID